MGKNSRGEEDEDEREMYRLRDMIVPEVSTVDRAANRKRFLVVKRKGETMGTGAEIHEDENGNLVTTEKQQITIPAPVKTAVQRTLTEALEKLMSAANKAKGAAPPPPTFGKDMVAIADMLDSVGKKYPSPVSKGDDKPEELAKQKTILRTLTGAVAKLMSVVNSVKGAKTTDEKMEKPLPSTVTTGVASVSAAVRSLGEKYPAAAQKDEKPTEKRGAKISQGRLAKLKEAFSTLQGLLKELGGESPTPASVGKAEIVELTKSLKELSDSTKSMKTLIEKQAAEIDRLKKDGTPPNSQRPEGGGKLPPKEVGWPMDMNRPISRESVAKQESFYGDDEN